MKLRISHQTDYLFSEEVFCEPHTFRFRPRVNDYQKLESFKLNINPDPAGMNHQLDPENNQIHYAWFNEKNKKLNILAESILMLDDFNPFNFIIDPAKFQHLPFQYNQNIIGYLGPYLTIIKQEKTMDKYIDHVIAKSGNNTLSFLLELTRSIHNDFEIILRPDGDPFSPEITFEQKKGSCRDLACMQIQMLRNMHLACRFTSGYFYFAMEKPSYELHAWLEVYLPGAGWIGFDPTHGILTGSSHIAIVSSWLSKNTMPVTGSIRGKASSQMDAKLIIEELI